MLEVIYNFIPVEIFSRLDKKAQNLALNVIVETRNLDNEELYKWEIGLSRVSQDFEVGNLYTKLMMPNRELTLDKISTFFGIEDYDTLCLMYEILKAGETFRNENQSSDNEDVEEDCEETQENTSRSSKFEKWFNHLSEERKSDLVFKAELRASDFSLYIFDDKKNDNTLTVKIIDTYDEVAVGSSSEVYFFEEYEGAGTFTYIGALSNNHWDATIRPQWGENVYEYTESDGLYEIEAPFNNYRGFFIFEDFLLVQGAKSISDCKVIQYIPSGRAMHNEDFEVTLWADDDNNILYKFEHCNGYDKDVEFKWEKVRDLSESDYTGDSFCPVNWEDIFENLYSESLEEDDDDEDEW